MIRLLTISVLSAVLLYGQAGPVERLRRMAPGQRQKLLERLPPERRHRIERQLRELDNMSPEQREQLHEQYAAFRRLPPEKQEALRGAFRRFNALPPARREALRKEMNELRAMRPRERRDRVQSEDFRNSYSQQEQMIMRRFGRVLGDEQGLP